VNEAMYWLGAFALLALAISELRVRLPAGLKNWRLKQTKKQMSKMDWSLIDNTVNSDRLRRDCERQESLGICTGRECLVYESCDFNIKKVVH
jgi:hypothetical protein